MAPSTPALLEAWEAGRAGLPVTRAWALLGMARPEATGDELTSLSVGQRDQALFQLREAYFGPRVVAVAGCPACGETLELDFDLHEVWVAPPSDGAPVVFDVDGYQVGLRPITVGGLLACVRGHQRDTRAALLEWSVIDAGRDGTTVATDALPAEVITRIEQRLAELDPQADVQLALSCSGCGHGWSSVFDIATFLWSEFDAWARRLLYEVHLLAGAYGWREADVLSLSPLRRRFYLEAVGS